MIYFIILLIFIVFRWRKNSDWDSLSKNLISVYLIVWLISLLVSCFGMYEFPVPKTSTFLLQLIHISSFFLGAMFCRRVVNHQCFETHIECELIHIQDSKFYKIICGIFFVYMIYLFSAFYQQMTIMMSLQDLRSSYYEGGLYGVLYDHLRGPILEPTFQFLSFIFSFSLLRKRTLWTLLSFLSVIIYTTLSGGRFGYVLLLVTIIFTYLVFSKSFQSHKRVYISFAIMGVLAYAAMLFVTNGRMSSADDSNIEEENIDVLQEHMTSYTSAPNVAFEYQIDHNIVERIGGYKYGALTFSSIENVLYSFVSKTSAKYDRPVIKLANITQNDRITLGHFNWNALYTSSLYYYCDFGIFGLILFPFLFGYCFRLSVFNLYKYKTIASFILCGSIFLKMIFSICMYGATDMYFAFFLIALYLLRKKRTTSNDMKFVYFDD